MLTLAIMGGLPSRINHLADLSLAAAYGLGLKVVGPEVVRMVAEDLEKGKFEKDLDDLPHHRGIVLTSAGVMPPLCKPETIKTVCDWVKAYNARM